MPKYWMITNRNVGSGGLGQRKSTLSYWVADSSASDVLDAWDRVSPARFRKLLAAKANEFPKISEPSRNEEQRHVTLFVHGYNTDWQEAVGVYRKIGSGLFSEDDSLGTCVLFTWPSNGSPLGYLPDRTDAERSAPDLAEILSDLYDWLVERQVAAAADPACACRAKTSVIAHSMGNYILQRAMQHVWSRKNQPLLVSLVNQLLMVAADVDNDLFKGGESITKSDGDAIANLSYRVTALYTGRDSVLGMSAGLKHFGKRRLGRSGLDRTVQPPDNVWDVDCSELFPAAETDIHSAYFESPATVSLMREVLRGKDRGVLRRERARAEGG